MKIEPGTKLKTRVGQDVTILSAEGRGEYPILGYIGESNFLLSWKADGSYCGSNEYRDDLILPQPEPEEWAAGKAAFAAGKVIQAKNGDVWVDTSGELPWSSSLQFRIKPEPKTVPLGPEDVPPGSVIRGLLWGNHSWSSINVSDLGVIWIGIDRFPGGVGNHEMSWGRLMESGFEIKRPGEDWKPCKKEVTV